MVKIISESWVEKDDPMFTGRFHVHSVRAKILCKRGRKQIKLKLEKNIRVKKNEKFENSSSFSILYNLGSRNIFYS